MPWYLGGHFYIYTVESSEVHLGTGRVHIEICAIVGCNVM